MPPEEWSRVIAASVVPVVIISACGLLCLAFYNRLSSIVARLRSFQRERLQEQDWLGRHASESEPAAARHHQVLEMLDVQTVHVTRRAHLVQRTLLCLLCAIGSLILCSLALGVSVVWTPAMYIAVLFFAVGLGCVLGAVTFAVRELTAALEPIELESRFVGDLAESIENLG